jgi:hypothetical protein
VDQHRLHQRHKGGEGRNPFEGVRCRPRPAKQKQKKKIVENLPHKRFSGDYFIPQPTLASIVILKCCPQDPGFR